MGYQALSALRLEQGIPWFGYDFGEKQIPHEAGLQDSHISYTKGCYTGQEIVERVRSRGQVNRVRVSGEIRRRTNRQPAVLPCSPTARMPGTSRGRHFRPRCMHPIAHGAMFAGKRVKLAANSSGGIRNSHGHPPPLATINWPRATFEVAQSPLAVQRSQPRRNRIDAGAA